MVSQTQSQTTARQASRTFASLKRRTRDLIDLFLNRFDQLGLVKVDIKRGQMVIRGREHMVWYFGRGCNNEVGSFLLNSCTSSVYDVIDTTLLIKPHIQREEAWHTLSASALNVIAPNFVVCHDVLKEGDGDNGLMTVIMSKSPFSLTRYVELLSEQNNQEVMLLAGVSLACQVLISTYAFGAILNATLDDREPHNMTVARTSKPNIDYTLLFSDTGVFSVPCLPKLSKSGFFGRLVMIDFGLMDDGCASGSQDKCEENVQAMLSNTTPATLVNHFDSAVDGHACLNMCFVAAFHSCNTFAPESGVCSKIRSVIEPFMDQLSGTHRGGKMLDHRGMILNAVNKLSCLQKSNRENNSLREARESTSRVQDVFRGSQSLHIRRRESYT